MAPLPLRFCLDLSYHAWARAADSVAAVARTIEVARVADKAGVDSLWVSEDPDGWDAFALLGALARETAHVRLGPGVANPYLRHPNLLAASVATLDRLSGGRAFLGLGRGQTEWYAHAFGMEVGKPVEVLEETFALLRQWWAPPYLASSVGHFAVQEWERTIGPFQAAPPVYLAAVGPRALDLAARHADGVLFNDLASDAFLAEAIAAVRAGAAAAGRDPARLEFYVRAGVTVTDDPEPVLERKKTYLALVNALPGMERLMATPDFDVPGIVAEVRRLMRTEDILARGGGFPALRRSGGLAAARAAIPTDLVARLAVVGPLSHVRARLRALASLGASHVFVASPTPGQTAATYRTALAALVAEETSAGFPDSAVG
ncbi:MAG: LLM class flavin-dependent oxidoreductase [Chloroflexota bacterium]|nr:LLM class flavin-dependent oxidoreductase [Chloroflexota bacterium]